MAAIHQTAGDLNAAGLMDQRTMRKSDAACLTPVRPLSASKRSAGLGLLQLWRATLPGVGYGRGIDPRRRQPSMSDTQTLLRDLIDIPERVQTNDFVLK